LGFNIRVVLYTICIVNFSDNSEPKVLLIYFHFLWIAWLSEVGHGDPGHETSSTHASISKRGIAVSLLRPMFGGLNILVEQTGLST